MINGRELLATLRRFITGDVAIALDGTATIQNLGNAQDKFLAWEDLRFPAQALLSGATPPDNIVWGGTSGATTLRCKGFDGGATVEQVDIICQLPHEWKEGSTLHPHVHWGKTTTGSGTVKWIFYYQWLNINGIGSATVSNVTATVDIGTTAWTHTMTDLGDIDGTGKTISSILIGKLSRDPTADTYGDDAALLEFDIHYQIDSVGSSEETDK